MRLIRARNRSHVSDLGSGTVQASSLAPLAGEVAVIERAQARFLGIDDQ